MERASGLGDVSHESVSGGVLVKVGGRGWEVDFKLDDKASFHQVEEGLRRHLHESQGWFTGETVTVNVGRRVLRPEELARIREVVEEEFQLKVSAFWCPAEIVEAAISEEAGVRVSLAPQNRDHIRIKQDSVAHVREKALSSLLSSQDNGHLFIRSTCRSGTRIQHAGDVVIRGDVNPGAQVIAGGDIIVLGSLRGIAHAGANCADPIGAVIIAFSLQPLQLRIGRHISVAPGDHHSKSIHPEIAYLNRGSIVVAPFTGKL